MKTTIKINLGGQIFTLDEDAYQVLKDYLDSISKRLIAHGPPKDLLNECPNPVVQQFLSRGMNE